MTRKVAVVTDSSPYIPQDLVDQYHIEVVPLAVIWGEEAYRDGVEITPGEFYNRLEHAEVMPSTTQPSAADFQAVFKRLDQAGYHILAVLLSDQLSGTIASAAQAKQDLPAARIAIHDSQSVAMACGFQVLAAARAAQEGHPLDHCLQVARTARERSGVVFVLDTLEFLHRGGRIGGAKRFFGTLLKVKPVLAIEEGVVVPLDQVRTHQKALSRVVDIIVDRTQGHKIIRLATLHANAPQTAEQILNLAADRISPQELVFSEVSPVIGTHAGLGAVGLAYLLDL